MQNTLPFPENAAAPSAANLPFVDYDYPASGTKFSGIALIGEAPGAEEAKLGHPFVGRSGQLLDKILAEAGINRKACLVANVFRHRPPNNKIDHFFASKRAAEANNIALAERYGKFGSALCQEEFATDIDHLAATFGKLKPRVIMALGRIPLWATTGHAEGLLKLVGHTLPCRLYADAPVIPTYHPSFILRGNWGLQEAWLGHFREALAD